MSVLEWIYDKAGKLRGFTVPHHQQGVAARRTRSRPVKGAVGRPVDAKWEGVDWAKPDKAISEELGVSRQRVHQKRRELGYPSATQQTRRRQEAILASLDTRSMTIVEIADALGADKDRAYQLLRENGLTSKNGGFKRMPHPAKGKPRPHRRKYDWDRIKDWASRSSVSIARELGAPPAYVSQYRKRKGLPKGVDGRVKENKRRKRPYGSAQRRARDLIRERRVMMQADFVEEGISPGSITPVLRTLERDGIVRVLRDRKAHVVVLTEPPSRQK